jgi:hypothetical protein
MDAATQLRVVNLAIRMRLENDQPSLPGVEPSTRTALTDFLGAVSRCVLS